MSRDWQLGSTHLGRGFFLFATWKRIKGSLIMKNNAKTFSLFPWRRYIRRTSHVFKLSDTYCSLLHFCAVNVVLRQKAATWIFLWDINVIMARFMFWKFTPNFYFWFESETSVHHSLSNDWHKNFTFHVQRV